MSETFSRPPTLTATVVDAIRTAILRGERQPGEPLREIEIGDSLGVSRGTVREALRFLQDENLVEVLPHRGVFVRTLTARTAHELYTLRAMIEPFAVRVALETKAYTPGDLQRLEALAVRLGELEHGDGDMYDTAQADVEFHHSICRPSGHQLLLQILSNLQSLTQLFVLNIHLYKAAVYSKEPSHYEIYEAIRSGDPGAGAEILRKHIVAAGESLLYCLGERGQA